MSWPTVSSLPPAGPPAPVIELRGASVRYRAPTERLTSVKEYAIRRVKQSLQFTEVWALREVDLDVQPGEMLGIIGRNGAGKTTLLKLVARVFQPTAGRVRVRGQVAPLLALGAGFDFELTGRENILLNGTLLGRRQRDLEPRIGPIAEFAELGHMLDAPLRTYSSGMVARMGFAIATDVRPDILIVDEVLSVGDLVFSQKSSERLRAFRAAGTTVLLVSHSLDLIESMCDRVAWIDHGALRALGEPGAVVGAYQQAAAHG